MSKMSRRETDLREEVFQNDLGKEDLRLVTKLEKVFRLFCHAPAEPLTVVAASDGRGNFRAAADQLIEFM